MKKELQLYLHIPFCIRKCEYCDFLSRPSSEELRKRYTEALLQELKAAAPAMADREVTTVFFGGGTPSLLTGEQMGRLMENLAAYFAVRADAEISMEGNPGTFTREALEAYRAAGMNRLSIGCQSAKDRELKALGRIHTFADFQKSYEMAREAGFANINVDLMSGLPGQSLEDWEGNLRTIAGMGPEHISAYSLILEEGTPFYGKELELPDEDTERRMYERTAPILGEYGYEQYEISNYARPGYACRHNVGYWRRKDYLGLGVGAASLIDNVRFSNTSSLETYLQKPSLLGEIRQNREVLGVKEQMEEFLFLGLRMRRGISKEGFSRAFGRELEEVYGPVLQKYTELGLLQERDGRVALTRAGISVSNPVLADFLL